MSDWDIVAPQYVDQLVVWDDQNAVEPLDPTNVDSRENLNEENEYLPPNNARRVKMRTEEVQDVPQEENHRIAKLAHARRRNE